MAGNEAGNPVAMEPMQILYLYSTIIHALSSRFFRPPAAFGGVLSDL